MKKRNLNKGSITLLMLLVVCVLIFTGCDNTKSAKLVNGKVNVITTFYPIYEFAKEIGGDDVNVINLLPTGVEPHDWTPRSQDIVNTSKSQLFLYNGAGLEGWVPNFLKGLNKNSKVKAVEVSQGVKLIEAKNSAEHDLDDEGSGLTNKRSHHIDPHTWVSPKSALIMAENIKKSYIEADPAHQSGYESRYDTLSQKLKDLDQKFEKELKSMPHHKIVVSHQAFGYLCRDYGLEQHAIMGLSPDAEPRARDLVELADMVRKEGIHYIFFEELVSDRLAKTLASETGATVSVLNPLEGLTQEEEQAGDNYFTLMDRNLQNLILALQ